MRAAVLLVVTFLASLVFSDAAAGAASLAVEQSSAEPGAALSRWGTIYFDVAYSADQPVRVQAEGFSGDAFPKGLQMNASVEHPAGDGHALAWISFSEPAAIDRVRITLYDTNFKPLAAIDKPFQARWSAEPAATSAKQPGWVVSLREEENRIAAEYARAHPPQPDPVGTLLFILMYLSVPAYFVAQAYCAVRFSGGWRIAALAPLILMAPVLAFTVFAGAAGSNLWPLYLLFAAPFGALYFIGLFAVRRTMAAGPFA
jgi:hypothetical protein